MLKAGWTALSAWVLILAAIPSFAANDDLGDSIQILLTRVSESGYLFIRNGKEYNAGDAAKHMRRKYEHYVNRIQSPEDFIELAGTKSILSGQKYLVLDINGVIPTADWLHDRLDEYRAAPVDRGAESE